MSSYKHKIRIIAAIFIIIVLFICLFFASDLSKNKRLIYGNTFRNDSGENLNDSFIDECFDPYLLASSQINISNEGHVFGFESILSPDDCIDKIKQSMKSKEWVDVESGDNLKCTFYKNGGCYSWLFLNIIKISGDTCVVITVD